MQSVYLTIICVIVLIFVESESLPVAVDDIEILDSDYIIYPNGEFRYSYRLSNGFDKFINGKLKTVNNRNVIVIDGSYENLSPTGQIENVHFIADENGYRIVKPKKGFEVVPTVTYGISIKGIESIIG